MKYLTTLQPGNLQLSPCRTFGSFLALAVQAAPRDRVSSGDMEPPGVPILDAGHGGQRSSRSSREGGPTASRCILILAAWAAVLRQMQECSLPGTCVGGVRGGGSIKRSEGQSDDKGGAERKGEDPTPSPAWHRCGKEPAGRRGKEANKGSEQRISRARYFTVLEHTHTRAHTHTHGERALGERDPQKHTCRFFLNQKQRLAPRKPPVHSAEPVVSTEGRLTALLLPLRGH